VAALDALVNVNVVRFLRLEAGVDLAAIKASVSRLVAGLAQGS
jgi:hypothetical protein